MDIVMGELGGLGGRIGRLERSELRVEVFGRVWQRVCGPGLLVEENDGSN
jgi:hypothetical protein